MEAPSHAKPINKPENAVRQELEGIALARTDLVGVHCDPKVWECSTYGTDTNETGPYLFLTTDQMRFYRIDAAESCAKAPFLFGSVLSLAAVGLFMGIKFSEK
jgi:hypothetical protein